MKTILIVSLLMVSTGCTVQSLNLGKGTDNSVISAGAVTARVTILDQGDMPVEGATVTGIWSGAVSGTSSAKTNLYGIATLVAPDSSKKGTYTVRVTGVSKGNQVYDGTRDVVTRASVQR